MTIKVWTTNYPSSIDTLTEQPIIVDGDDVDETHVNILSQVVRELQSQVGSNLIEAGSVKASLSQHLPRLTWTDVATISITAWPGQSSTVHVLFQDAVLRSFTGTLTFSPAVSGEGGLDTGSEADVWYYLYLVPTAADNSLLTVVGSTAIPTTGPTGYTNFKYIGAVKNISGDLVSFFHDHYAEFAWEKVNTDFNNTTTDASPVQYTLQYVPATASSCELLLWMQGNSSGAYHTGTIRLWVDNGSAPTDTVDTTVMCCHYQLGNWCIALIRGIIPLATPQSLYYRKERSAGSLLHCVLRIQRWTDMYLIV